MIHQVVELFWKFFEEWTALYTMIYHEASKVKIFQVSNKNEGE